jgi:hypothetical protein
VRVPHLRTKTAACAPMHDPWIGGWVYRRKVE